MIKNKVAIGIIMLFAAAVTAACGSDISYQKVSGTDPVALTQLDKPVSASKGRIRLISEINKYQTYTIQTAENDMNVFSKPDGSSSWLGTVKKDEMIIVYSNEGDGWLKISFNGRVAYAEE